MKSLIPFALVPAACTPAVAPQSDPTPYQSARVDVRLVWLGDHNRERAAYGSPPLAWDEDLARGATAYARILASEGRLRHSAKGERRGQGENLWLGTRGAYAPGAMTGTWLEEKRFFRRGVFPNVSRTGDWRHVGHYTAMIWPTTTRVGCGLASSPRWDVLVCRYSPSGNRDGVRL